MIKGQEM